MNCQTNQSSPCGLIPLVCLACVGLYFLTSNRGHEQKDVAAPIAAESKLIRRVSQANDAEWPGPDARIAEDQGLTPDQQEPLTRPADRIVPVP